MKISVLKMHFQKLPPKIIYSRDFKKFISERFMNSLLYNLSEEHTDCSKMQKTRFRNKFLKKPVT